MKASVFSGRWEERLLHAERGVGQEHGRELKNVWSVAQGNVTAGAGDFTREHAEG